MCYVFSTLVHVNFDRMYFSRYCKTLFFRRILILRFPCVENLLHFNFADFPVNFINLFPLSFGASNKCYYRNSPCILLFTLYNTKNIAYHITEELIFYADKIMVMGNSKNLRVFNFTILLKSRKFDAREIYTSYSIWECLHLALSSLCW